MLMADENMKYNDLRIGDIVQLKPEHKFCGMLVVVTETFSWGCQGYLMSPWNFEAIRFKGLAYVRPKSEDFELVGTMHWVLELKKDKEENETV